MPEDVKGGLAKVPGKEETHRYVSMKKTEIETAMRNFNLELSGPIDSETAVEVGAWLGADAVVLGSFGAVPFLVSSDLPLSLADALFESVSGLTTTGATVIVGLDELPRSLLLYRQQLQWLGGIGIIVLAVAILPMGTREQNLRLNSSS